MPGTLHGLLMWTKESFLDSRTSGYSMEQQGVQTFGAGTSEVRVLGKKKKVDGMASG